jgi:hypothetical protein
MTYTPDFGPDRVEAAKAAANAVLDLLRPSDTVGVWQFAQGGASTVASATKNGSQAEFAEVRQEIEKLVKAEPRNQNAALFPVIAEGMKELAEQRPVQEQRPRRVLVVLTDSKNQADDPAYAQPSALDKLDRPSHVDQILIVMVDGAGACRTVAGSELTKRTGRWSGACIDDLTEIFRYF